MRRIVELVGVVGIGSRFQLFSDHDECFFATEKEWILIDHRLHDVFQVRAHRLESQHVGELDWKERRPPANRYVLAVHAVEL